jgi:hypothetical protein
MVVNPFDGMKIGSHGARERECARGAVLPHGLRPGDAEVSAVILINLLPHRELARKKRKPGVLHLGLGRGGRGGRPGGGRGLSLVPERDFPATGAQRLPGTSEIKRLDEEIKDIATLREEIDALKARQQAVEDLQANRNLPVHLLNELVLQRRMASTSRASSRKTRTC